MQKTSYPGILSAEEITASEKYFFKKPISEAKEFVKENEYQKNSFQKDGILYYKGSVNCNEGFMLKHLLCTCNLQAFTPSVQYSKRNPLACRYSKTFRCRNCMEIRFETRIHNAG